MEIELLNCLDKHYMKHKTSMEKGFETNDIFRDQKIPQYA
jgi:hypothetical protein